MGVAEQGFLSIESIVVNRNATLLFLRDVVNAKFKSRIATSDSRGTAGRSPNKLLIHQKRVWQISSSRGAREGLWTRRGRGVERRGCGSTCGRVGVRMSGWVVALRRLGGGPLLVKVVGGEVFGRVVRMRVHTWWLRGGRGGSSARPVVLAAAVRARPAAAVRRALASPHTYTLPYTDHRTRWH